MDERQYVQLKELIWRRCGGGRGRQSSDADIEKLSRVLGAVVPQWYKRLLLDTPLAGSVFEYSGEDNWSWTFEWLDAKQTIDEAVSMIPGMVAVKRGYIPVGECLLGSGDPLFMTNDPGDPKLVQIFHDVCDVDGELIDKSTKLVCSSLAKFIATSRII